MGLSKTKEKDSASDILKAHGLKRTPARKAVLALFNDADVALSHSDVERSLEGDHDRVTVYRTLVSFEEKGLIHRVLGPDGVVKFAGCESDCNEYSHFDEHVHFHCRECGDTFCLPDVRIPTPAIGNGHVPDAYRLSVEGICKRCK